MTEKEHKLIIGMLATQLALTSELITILRDNGTLRPADFQKIWQAAISTGPEKAHIYQQVTQLYKGIGKSVGVTVDVPDDFPSAGPQTK